MQGWYVNGRLNKKNLPVLTIYINHIFKSPEIGGGNVLILSWYIPDKRLGFGGLIFQVSRMICKLGIYYNFPYIVLDQKWGFLEKCICNACFRLGWVK